MGGDLLGEMGDGGSRGRGRWRWRIQRRADLEDDLEVGLDQKLVARELSERSIVRLVKLVARFLMNRANHRFQLVKLNERANEFHE